uniref:RING-type domain-containing protein n=1 Tax=Aegilops tauschii subsp. strangulata TaxID=200361 RepID=A0A453RZX5_AEGTS
MDREAIVQRAEPAQAGRRAQPLRGGHQHHRQDARVLRRGQPHPLLWLRRRDHARLQRLQLPPGQLAVPRLRGGAGLLPERRAAPQAIRADVLRADRGGRRRHRGQDRRPVPCPRHRRRRPGVTRSVDTSEGDLSPQERRTVDSIVMASSYPLSIVLVGVGDGPWEDMQKFDDKLPARAFDNFQFVNFTSIMSRNATLQQKESAFALAALMEVPIQYKATMELGILGRSTGKAKRVVPAPPPLPASAQRQPSSLRLEASSANAAAAEPREDQVCPICLTNAKDLAFGCGHMCCRECGENLDRCPICRETIRSKLRLYTG